MNRHQQRRIDRLDTLVLDLQRRVACLETGNCAITSEPTKADVRGPGGATASKRRDEVKAAAVVAKASVATAKGSK